MKSLLATVAVATLVVSFAQTQRPRPSADGSPNGSAAPSSYLSVTSPNGIHAHYLRFTTDEGDFEGQTFIEKEGRVVATLKGVRPISFSPTQDVLLLREDVADDDLRHYLLDIGAGQYALTIERNEAVFGSRYVARTEWSEDGRHLVLFDAPGLTDAPPQVITTAEHLGQAQP